MGGSSNLLQAANSRRTKLTLHSWYFSNFSETFWNRLMPWPWTLELYWLVRWQSCNHLLRANWVLRAVLTVLFPEPDSHGIKGMLKLCRCALISQLCHEQSYTPCQKLFELLGLGMNITMFVNSFPEVSQGFPVSQKVHQTTTFPRTLRIHSYGGFLKYGYPQSSSIYRW